MALLQLKRAKKRYPEQVIFRNASLQIQKQDRIGLIGVNGTGKSTLLKILTGEEHLDEGKMMVSNDLEIGYLTQDINIDLDLDITLYQEMLSIYQELFNIEESLRKLEAKMSQASGSDLDQIMRRYSRLREEYEEKDGYQYESRIKGVLRGLGFTEEDFEGKLVNFSGGEKTRVVLAKLLLQQPQLLLLDEPTNHLDLAAREWLEDYLKDYPGAIIIISHDRYFLDEVVKRLWELEKGRLEKYSGNYSFYLQEKPRKLLTWQREYEKQQEKIKKMKAYIRKNKAGINAKQAKGRQKKLDRMEKIPPPPKLETPNIEFKLDTVSGEDVLQVSNLAKSYGGELLFEDINFRVYRGEKIALVGPNGSGKSTLLKLLLDIEEPDRGEIKYGTRVKPGYYDQEHAGLTSEYNLIEELQKIDGVKKSQARDFLARFLFKGEDVFRKISTLSGGEKTRVALAKLALQDHNLLLLDEPTNHLDIKSKEILEEALQNYPGTVIVISHDRYFLDNIVNKVLALQDNSLVEHTGNYSDYRKKYFEFLSAQEENQTETTDEKLQEAQGEKSESEETTQQVEVDLAKLESEIMELENKVEELEKKFSNQELYNDEKKLADLTKEYEAIKEQLEEYYELWEEVI